MDIHLHTIIVVCKAYFIFIERGCGPPWTRILLRNRTSAPSGKRTRTFPSASGADSASGSHRAQYPLIDQRNMT